METRRVLPTNIIKLDNETTWICLTLSLGMMMAHYKAFFFMHHMMDLRLAYMQTNLWKNKSTNYIIVGGGGIRNNIVYHCVALSGRYYYMFEQGSCGDPRVNFSHCRHEDNN